MNLNQNKISGNMKLFISVFTFFAVCFTFADAQTNNEDHPHGIREVFHSVPSIPARICKDKPECGQLLKAMGGSCVDVPMNRAMIYCQKTCGYCNTAAISSEKLVRKTTEAPCFDKRPKWCDRAIRKGSCVSIPSEYSAKVCRKSCGHCGWN